MSLELPEERLATTDASGKRVFLYPLETKGRFRHYRNLVQLFLLSILVITPWTKFNGIQTVLLDIPQRRFTFFGVTFWAHDAPLIFFLLAGVAFCLAFMAIIFGRVWCGWACPQTVFIDGLFRKIEQFIEGSAHQRRALDQSPMSSLKLIKKTLKWTAFATVTALITNSLLAYFVGIEVLMTMVRSHPSQNPETFAIAVFTFSVLLFNFGWFREQFCIIMCPYGRMQSVMMDSSSMIVLYDQKRGEPRKGLSSDKQGDCVNCFRCVAVCPTGIDIRRGTQLECIACAACIDACDEIMDKINKPKGLIRYGREHAGASWIQVKHAFFGFILLLILSGLSWQLYNRRDFTFNVLRASGAPFEVVDKDHLTNRFVLEANSHSSKAAQLFLSAEKADVIMAENPVTLKPGATNRVGFFLKFDSSNLKNGAGIGNIEIRVERQKIVLEVPLVGPIR